MGVRAALLATMAFMAGCSSIEGTYPRDHPLIPDATLRLSEGYSITFEKMITYAGLAVAAWLVLDPKAPNWRIEEARLPADQVLLSLRMKRIRTGGDGEARAVFHRRAAALAREGGFEGYQVLSYSEALESTLPAPQRTSEGMVQLVRRQGGQGTFTTDASRLKQGVEQSL